MNTTTRPLFRTTMPSPIGPLTLIANDDAIVAIRWDEETPDAHNPVDRKLGDEFVDVGSGEHPALDQAVAQLAEYFAGTRVDFDLPLDPDVFLDTDLGVRHALTALDLSPDAAERWRPWRTYAMHHLWATL